MGRARGRMLSWRISESVKVNGLSGPWPMLLYTWMIAHCDNLGRFHGESEQVKAMVFPRRRDISLEQVEVWLDELAETGLVQRYLVDGLWYISFPDEVWNREQRLHHTLSKHSDLPDISRASRVAHVNLTCDSRHEREREVEGEVEVEVEREREVEVEPEGECREGTISPATRTPNVNGDRKSDLKPKAKPEPSGFWEAPAVTNRLMQFRDAGFSVDVSRKAVLAEFNAGKLIP